MDAKIKPFWVRGGRRSIVDHPEDIKEILRYLKENGDLRANAKHVELLWIQFSKKFGTDWLTETAVYVERFAKWLENEIDENDYFTVIDGYAEWKKTFKLSE